MFLHKIRLVLSVFLLIFAAACARVPTAPQQPEQNLQEICAVNSVQWQMDSVSQVVTLTKGSSRARVLVGSDVVVIGSKKISLSAPLRRVKNDIRVPSDFKRKVIDVLANKVDSSARKFREIVIDAGHGGKDPGAISRGGTKEKDIVLDISKRLKRILEEQGMTVTMTRTKDEFISLERRTEMASQSKADLFVSVHANSSKSKNAKGVEVYYLRELEASEKKDEQMKKNQKIYCRQIEMSPGSAVLDDIVSDMLYVYKREESEKLARHINRGVPSWAKGHTRGCKTAGFFVLRNTLIPAILLEVGFITNPVEERLLKTANYRQQVADGIAESILDYANYD